MRRISVASVEVLAVVVGARIGGTVVNPTTFPVSLGFTASGTGTAPTTWYAASWNTDSSGGSPIYLAEILIGPGTSVPLTLGLWVPWAMLVASPETPVLQGEAFTIY